MHGAPRTPSLAGCAPGPQAPPSMLLCVWHVFQISFHSVLDALILFLQIYMAHFRISRRNIKVSLRDLTSLEIFYVAYTPELDYKFSMQSDLGLLPLQQYEY